MAVFYSFIFSRLLTNLENSTILKLFLDGRNNPNRHTNRRHMGAHRFTLPHGYRWRCISDPTGLFEGRVFRKSDLEPEQQEDNWLTDGMIFKHVKKPDRVLMVKDHQLIQIQAQAGD